VVRVRAPLLMKHAEPETFRVECNRASHILRLVADAVKAPDETVLIHEAYFLAFRRGTEEAAFAGWMRYASLVVGVLIASAYLTLAPPPENVDPWNGEKLAVVMLPRQSVERLDPWSGREIVAEQRNAWTLDAGDPWDGDISF